MYKYSSNQARTMTMALACSLFQYGVCQLRGQVSPSATAAASPERQDGRSSTPTLKAEARLVALDVVVTDEKGHTVTNLAPSDFKVLEQGTQQTLVSFEAHTRPSSTNIDRELQARLPPNTFSDYPARQQESSAIVLVLDALDSPSVGDQMYLREQMIAYMKAVSSGTRIAIVQLDTDLHLIQDFSGDPEQLLRAVGTGRNQPKLSPLPDPPCSHTEAGPSSGANGGSSGGAFKDRDIPDCPRDYLARIDPAVHKTVVSNERSAVLNRTLPNLLQFANAVPGRKTIVWFYSQDPPGEAYHSSVKAMFDADQQSMFADFSRSSKVLNLNQISLVVVNISSRFGLNPVNDAIDTFARAHGGEAFSNTNGFKEIMEHVADTAWNYYTLYYSPTNRTFDGAYRRLQVQVDRPGLQLQYRRGYYAAQYLPPRSEIAGRRLLPNVQAGGTKEDSLVEAMALGGAAHNDVLFSASIDAKAETSKPSALSMPAKENFLSPAFSKQRYRLFTVNYNVDSQTIQLSKGVGSSYQGHLYFVAVVYDDRGAVANSIRSKVSVHADEHTKSDLLVSGIKVTQRVAVPIKGARFLRLGVQDQSTAKLGIIELPVDAIQVGLVPH